MTDTPTDRVGPDGISETSTRVIAAMTDAQCIDTSVVATAQTYALRSECRSLVAAWDGDEIDLMPYAGMTADEIGRAGVSGD